MTSFLFSCLYLDQIQLLNFILFLFLTYLCSFVLWPLEFQIQERIVSAETIWGNTVFFKNWRHISSNGLTLTCFPSTLSDVKEIKMVINNGRIVKKGIKDNIGFELNQPDPWQNCETSTFEGFSPGETLIWKGESLGACEKLIFLDQDFSWQWNILPCIGRGGDEWWTKHIFFRWWQWLEL